MVKSQARRAFSLSAPMRRDGKRPSIVDALERVVAANVKGEAR
jgi:hypothetical protein